MSEDGRGKAGALRIVAVVLLLATVAAASGGLGMAAPPGPRGAAADSETLGALLTAAAANPARGREIAVLARSLGQTLRAEGVEPSQAFVQAFPPSQAVLSMLALDRDIDDFEEAGQGEGAAAAHYRRAAREAEVLRALRPNYAKLYSGAWHEIGAPPESGGDREERRLEALEGSPMLAAPAAKGELMLPPLRDLGYSHPYALDIFFEHVEESGEAEYGPEIRAIEAGIVVAAAADWRGGAGAERWLSGGLSPSAGNGVVVYCPVSGRYYSYFHFSETRVRRGDVVAAGEAIGRGGNSGANARKPGHGRHLHLEIFDTTKDRALSAWEIRSML